MISYTEVQRFRGLEVRVITTVISSDHTQHAKDPETHPSLLGHTRTITVMSCDIIKL